MSDELLFSVNDALVSNLDRLSREHSIVSEQRLLELREIAEEMVSASIPLLESGLNVCDVLAYLSDSVILGQYSLSELTSQESAGEVRKVLSSLARLDRAILASYYVSQARAMDTVISESDFLPSHHSAQTFTYVRNVFSDEAYDVFSQDFSVPTVRYSNSFKECALAVSENESEYCLLPLEERGGVRLPTVSEIIFRNDFKINSVIPVFGPDGMADMKYALISKSFTLPVCRSDDDRYLEVRLGASGESTLTDFLLAVDYFSMSVYRINTLTIDNEGESEIYYSAVIRVEGKDLTPLLAYLTLFNRDFVPVGVYKNLE